MVPLVHKDQQDLQVPQGQTVEVRDLKAPQANQDLQGLPDLLQREEDHLGLQGPLVLKDQSALVGPKDQQDQQEVVVCKEPQGSRGLQDPQVHLEMAQGAR